MIELIVIAVIILAATATAAYSLTLLDQVVWANPYWTILRMTQALLGVIAVFTLVSIVLIYKKHVSQKQLALRTSEKAKTMLTRRKEFAQLQPQLPPTPQIRPTSELTFEPMPPPAAQPVPQPIPQPTPQPEASPVSTMHTPPAPPSENKIDELMSEIRTVSTMRTSSTPSSATVSSSPGLIHCSNCGKAFSQPLRMLDFHGERPRIVNICPFCNEVVQPTLRQDEMEQSKKVEQKKKRDNKTHETAVTPPLSG